MVVRTPHILSTIKGNELFNRIVLMDSESMVDNIDTPEAGRMIHHPFLLVSRFINYDKGKRYDRTEIYWSDNERFDPFYTALDHFTKSGTRTVVYAHNMGYDHAVCKGDECMVRLGYTAKPPFVNGPIFVMEYRNSATRKTVVFLSSTNYYAASLKELGKTFNHPKIEIDYATMPRDEVEKYCTNDIDILDLAITAFRKFVEDNDMGGMQVTLAKQSMNAFRHRFMDHQIYMHCEESVLQLERDAYFGGRVDCFKVGKFKGKFFKLDVNSMYPAEMYEKQMPVKLRWHRRKSTIDEVQEWIRLGYAVIARCIVDTPIPCFPYIADGVLLYPTDSFHTTLCTPELQYAINHNYIQSIGEVAVYETANIFRRYVEWFYPRKRDEKDPILKYLFKIFLNALYGKFGQRAHEHIITGSSNAGEFGVEHIRDHDTGEWYTIKRYGGIASREVEGNTPLEREGFDSFPAIAAHVTSGARIRLWEYIETAGLENVYYCDTDSIFTNKVGHDRVAALLHPTELGKMKVEETATTLEIRNPKDYTFGDKTRRKGVRKDSVQKDKNTWMVVQWPSFTGAMRLPGVYENLVRYKHLDPYYKKAWVLPNGDTVPLSFNPKLHVPMGRYKNKSAVLERFAAFA